MKVDPIKDEKKIATIKKILADEPRNLLLFILGLNSGLRIGDLLKLRVKDVIDLKEGGKVELKEQKTGKYNYFMVNKEIYKALQYYFDSVETDPDDYLFKSRKGANSPLTIQSAHALVMKWCNEVGLRGNYGCHSLRKTFGYIMRWKHGIDIEVLMKRFNHSSQSTTLRYIGLEDQDVSDCLMNYSI